MRTRGAATGTLLWEDKSITQEVPQVVIRIQQDGPNAPDDRQWLERLQQKGLKNKILLYTQPANSPDLNINDLGFVSALQAYYQQFSAKTPTEIINYVQQTYQQYPQERINHVWLSLMSVMNEIIDCNGDNDYEIPHLAKEAKERRNELPVVLQVTNTAKEYLGQN